MTIRRSSKLLSLLILSVFFGATAVVCREMPIRAVDMKKATGLEIPNNAHIYHDPETDMIQILSGPPGHPKTVHLMDPFHAQKYTAPMDLPKQWLAWYYKTQLPLKNGFENFSSTWQVPNLPSQPGNIAIFNGLQPSYDPRSYNFILQPVTMVGDWMLGSYSQYILSAVLCKQVGGCLWTKPIPTKPGNTISGKISMDTSIPQKWAYIVNITDLTEATPPQILHYHTPYFVPWAFLTLEHNPAGPIGDCGKLPQSTTLSFYENTLNPPSSDTWSGSQNTFECGISIQNFVYSDSPITITI